LLQIDKLVNGTLYGYGLTFSTGWAEPYWAMLRSSLVLIVIAIIIISVVELPYPSFRNQKNKVEDRE
jgi:CBS-domain-containing membrane protein